MNTSTTASLPIEGYWCFAALALLFSVWSGYGWLRWDSHDETLTPTSRRSRIIGCVGWIIVAFIIVSNGLRHARLTSWQLWVLGSLFILQIITGMADHHNYRKR